MDFKMISWIELCSLSNICLDVQMFYILYRSQVLYICYKSTN